MAFRIPTEKNESWRSRKELNWPPEMKSISAEKSSLKIVDSVWTQCLKIAQKVAVNIASEASYVYISLKMPKTANLVSLWKTSVCGQTVLPDRSILIGQKLVEMPELKIFKWDIMDDYGCRRFNCMHCNAVSHLSGNPLMWRQFVLSITLRTLTLDRVF